jgi:hypothetical protein
MAQVLSKEYSCYNCKKAILISKIDNPAPGSKKKWEQWELDSVTPHECPATAANPLVLLELELVSVLLRQSH